MILEQSLRLSAKLSAPLQLTLSILSPTVVIYQSSSKNVMIIKPPLNAAEKGLIKFNNLITVVSWVSAHGLSTHMGNFLGYKFLYTYMCTYGSCYIDPLECGTLEIIWEWALVRIASECFSHCK
jgi:hypothetical protein